VNNLVGFGNDTVKALGFPIDDADELFFISSSGAMRAPILPPEPAMAVSGWRISWCNCRGKDVRARTCDLGGDFLFKPAEISEVLKVKYVTTALDITRPKRRHADAEVALLTVRGDEFNLAAPAKGAH